MSLAYGVHAAVVFLDRHLSRIQVKIHERRGTLTSLYFHCLFRDQTELESERIYPQQGTTVDQFREILQYFVERDYVFISPADCLRPLDPQRRYVHVSFDDGYYNNLRALPVLQELNVSATFFVSARHVQEGRLYWWDLLYRLLRAQGKKLPEIEAEATRLQTMETERIYDEIERRFGQEPGGSSGELDRPFTPEELYRFARDPHVVIGNHTYFHAVLTNYPLAKARAEIQQGQKLLQEMTGSTPISIAYPNGSHDPDVVRIAREEGLRVGFGTRPRKEYFPGSLAGDGIMTLGRFCPVGSRPVSDQAGYFRSDLMLHERYQSAKTRLRKSVSGNRAREN